MPNQDYWNYADKVYPSHDKVRQYLEPLIKLFSPGRTIADLACGRGELLEALKHYGHNGFGVDTSLKSQKWVAEAGFPFYNMDVLKFLKKPPADYDGLFCYGFLEHLSPLNLNELFKAMGKHCPDGTEVVFATHNPKSIQAHLIPLYMDETHQRLYSEEIIIHSFEVNGFKVKKSGSIEQKKTLLSSSVLLPQRALDFRNRLEKGIKCFGPLKYVLLPMFGLTRFILGRIHVIEMVLKEITTLLNKPLDYYVFAVKQSPK